MRHGIFVLTCCLQLAACASIESRPRQDRFGIMTINIPSHWYDDTEKYLQETQKLREHKRKAPDPGIKSLLMLKSHAEHGYCKFRELRYFATEIGYQWGVERLATEIALANNRVLNRHDMVDYLRMGISTPVLGLKVSRSELVSSSAIKLNMYSGWKTTYRNWFGETDSREHTSLALTVVIRSDTQATSRSQKLYIVAECAADGNKVQIDTTEKQILAILNTIRLGQ